MFYKNTYKVICGIRFINFEEIAIELHVKLFGSKSCQ